MFLALKGKSYCNILTKFKNFMTIIKKLTTFFRKTYLLSASKNPTIELFFINLKLI